MSNENELWKMNVKFVEMINELTEEVIHLKREKRINKELKKELEELKQLYYKTLADHNQSLHNTNNKNRSLIKRLLGL